MITGMINVFTQRGGIGTMGEETFQNFITILNEELIPALGCT